MDSISTRIASMHSPDEFDQLVDEVLRREPILAVVYLSEVLTRRSQLYDENTQVNMAARERYASAVLSSFENASGFEHGFRLIRTDPGRDALEPWRAWPPEGFQALAHHYETAKAPLLRALYAQALWELRPLWARSGILNIRPIEMMHAAVDAHMDAADWLASIPGQDPATVGLRIVEHWKTVYTMAERTGHIERLGPGLDRLRALIEMLRGAAPHWALDLIGIEVEFASAAKDGQALVASERLDALMRLIDGLERDLIAMGGMEHMLPEALEVRARIERARGAPPTHQELAVRRAQLNVQRCGREPSPIVRAMIWKQAAAEFQRAGRRDEAANAKAAARKALREADESGEFKAVSVKVSIAEEDVTRVVAPFFDGALTAEEVLARAGMRLFVPSLETVTVSRHRRPKSLASQIALTVPIVDDRSMAAVAPGTPEQEVDEANRDLHREVVLMSSVVLMPLMARLRSEHHLHAEDLTAFIGSSEFVAPDDLPFLRRAAYAYVERDLAVVIHLLAPRAEQMVRRLASAAGVDVTALRDGAMRERTLGEIIRAARDDGVLPEPLARLLQVVIAEEWGLNLRNEVAHGLLKPEACSEAITDRLVHTLLVLASLRVGPE